MKTKTNHTTRQNQVKRAGDGKFLPGVSGNPNGRLRLPESIKAMLSTNAQVAVEAIVKHLTDTDPKVALKASELLLDRCFGRPQAQATHVAFDVPGGGSGLKGLLASHGALIQSVAKGETAIEDAKGASDLLETHRRLIETTELEERISRLEATDDQP